MSLVSIAHSPKGTLLLQTLHYNSLTTMSRLNAAFNAAVPQPSLQASITFRHPSSCSRHVGVRSALTVQTLAQQYQHPLSSCIAQSQHQQQPVSCSRHSRSSTIRYSTAGAGVEAGVEAAAAASAQEQQQQQQPSSNGSSHQVIDMDAVDESNADRSSSSRPGVVIKVLTSADELQAVARLRAEAYYAVSCSARIAGNSDHSASWILWRILLPVVLACAQPTTVSWSKQHLVC
jgi:hypothetical protein